MTNGPGGLDGATALTTAAGSIRLPPCVDRQRGTAGSESISLRIDNTNVATWTLTTSLQDYSASTGLNGDITVAFTNDASGRDVQVDYIVVNGTTRQAEAQSVNTALYANGRCGGGGNSDCRYASDCSS